MPFQCARGPYSKNEEPTLDELLAEPAVRLVMARDRVDEAEVRRIVVETRERREKYRRDRGKIAGTGGCDGDRI
jgi:hypothetical protein